MNNTPITDNTGEMQRCFEWIKLCIGSCTEPFHLECCNTLMQLFELRFGENESWSYNSQLKDIWLNKEHDLINR